MPSFFLFSLIRKYSILFTHCPLFISNLLTLILDLLLPFPVINLLFPPHAFNFPFFYHLPFPLSLHRSHFLPARLVSFSPSLKVHPLFSRSPWTSLFFDHPVVSTVSPFRSTVKLIQNDGNEVCHPSTRSAYATVSSTINRFRSKGLLCNLIIRPGIVSQRRRTSHPVERGRTSTPAVGFADLESRDSPAREKKNSSLGQCVMHAMR